MLTERDARCATVKAALRNLAPPTDFLARGAELVNNQKQPLMRFVGERSLARLIGRLLGSGDETCERAWDRSEADLRSVGDMVIQQAIDASVPQRRQVRRWALPGDHCYLLERGTARWALLREAARHLHETCCSGEVGLIAAWAWDAWVMDNKYGKIWAIFAMLSQIMLLGLADHTLPAARDAVCATSLDDFGESTFCSIHPCAPLPFHGCCRPWLTRPSSGSSGMHYASEAALRRILQTDARCPECRAQISFARKFQDRWLRAPLREHETTTESAAPPSPKRQKHNDDGEGPSHGPSGE